MTITKKGQRKKVTGAPQPDLVQQRTHKRAVLRTKLRDEVRRGEARSTLSERVPLIDPAEHAPFQEAIKTREDPKRRCFKTQYHPDYARVAEAMSRLGATDAEICRALGIASSTLWTWQAEHEDFFRAMILGKEFPNKRVERALYQRAVGYSRPALKIMQHEGRPVVVPYVEYLPPDPGAASRWLERRDPDNWSMTQKVELTGDESFVAMWRMISEGQVLPIMSQEEVNAGGKQPDDESQD